jgi:pimeloyl-ACP methyl ester carboxylesterase
MSTFITFKNTKIHFSEYGKGNAVILLHGFLENSTMWADIAPQLSKKNRVVAIDLLGHGHTESLGYVHSMELMADAVQAVIKHLKIRRATFIGHSMGGYVALAYAEKYPDTIKGLCLMNSTSKADTLERKKNRDRAIKAVKQNHKTFIRMSIANLFRPKNRTLFAHKIKEVKREALKTPLQSIVAALEGMKIRQDREDVLHFGPFKKMMIISKKDPVLNYKDLIEQTKNTNIITIQLPDGHMSHIENKEIFSYNIMHFIENT